MHANHSTTRSAMIDQWEEAGVTLASAVSRFFDLSILLEANFTTHKLDENNLITRIDSSLETIQTTINQQLGDACIALAKTRNRLASSRSILSFPHEVLSQIFLNVVFDLPPVKTYMKEHIKIIYSRLHSLLGVCTIWRDVALGCGALWSIVPVIDGMSDRLRSQSTDLSLKRAGKSKDLYLAMVLGQDMLLWLDLLYHHISRFGIINIHETVHANVSLSDILRIIFEYDAPRLLSKLSLRYSGGKRARNFNEPTGVPDNWLTSLEPQLIQLAKSLSVLRLYDIGLDWQNVAFSDRLVTLLVGGISLGAQHKINSFISALASATKLRDLSLVSLNATPDHTENLPVGTLVLPRLESLHLARLDFNLFSLFLAIITPKSYRLNLNLNHSTTSGRVVMPNSNVLRTFASNDEICAQLKKANVHRLVLTHEAGCAWESPANLHTLLQSVPTVKSLSLNCFELDQDILAVLNPPLYAFPESAPANTFPQLETIEFHACRIISPLGNLRAGFQDLLANHPIRRLELGKSAETFVSRFATDLFVSEDQEGQDLEVLTWLGYAVPHFQWLPQEAVAPDMTDTWELWDI